MYPKSKSSKLMYKIMSNFMSLNHISYIYKLKIFKYESIFLKILEGRRYRTPDGAPVT